jgi:hypothetical protein
MLRLLCVLVVAVAAAGGCSRETSPPPRPPAQGAASRVPDGNDGSKSVEGQGRIPCGSESCNAGSQVCCQSDGSPGAARARCIDVEPSRIATDLGALDQMCDGLGLLLVTCGDSSSCAPGQACCESVWGSGQNSPITCREVKRGERFPCDYREACAEGARCLTEGARCEAGWCVVREPVPSVQCGEATCSGGEICCLGGSGSSQCSTRAACEGNQYTCTKPSNCIRGDFCGVTPGGSACSHTWDGMTELLCETVVDCPGTFRDFCKGREEEPQCVPAQTAPPWAGRSSQGVPTCQCAPRAR